MIDYEPKRFSAMRGWGDGLSAFVFDGYSAVQSLPVDDHPSGLKRLQVSVRDVEQWLAVVPHHAGGVPFESLLAVPKRGAFRGADVRAWRVRTEYASVTSIVVKARWEGPESDQGSIRLHPSVGSPETILMTRFAYIDGHNFAYAWVRESESLRDSSFECVVERDRHAGYVHPSIGLRREDYSFVPEDLPLVVVPRASDDDPSMHSWSTSPNDESDLLRVSPPLHPSDNVAHIMTRTSRRAFVVVNDVHLMDLETMHAILMESFASYDPSAVYLDSRLVERGLDYGCRTSTSAFQFWRAVVNFRMGADHPDIVTLASHLAKTWLNLSPAAFSGFGRRRWFPTEAIAGSDGPSDLLVSKNEDVCWNRCSEFDEDGSDLVRSECSPVALSVTDTGVRIRLATAADESDDS